LWCAAPGGESFDVFSHRTEGGLIVEFERRGPERLMHPNLIPRVRETIALLQECSGAGALPDNAVEQVRSLTNHDRVVVYKFIPVYGSQVVAELVANGILRSWHGAIMVRSELGQGATFVLYVPVIESPLA
jgi:light-regulated signal transduction histidine kinase (bacteriophytochrome)